MATKEQNHVMFVVCFPHKVTEELSRYETRIPDKTEEATLDQLWCLADLSLVRVCPTYTHKVDQVWSIA